MIVVETRIFFALLQIRATYVSDKTSLTTVTGVNICPSYIHTILRLSIVSLPLLAYVAGFNVFYEF